MGRTACAEPQRLYKGALYLHLTVELYLYSPYGPYDLYRASVPVQCCTVSLPLPLLSSPVPVAARSKAWVWESSLAEIVCSNPTRGMDVCLL